MQPDTAKCFLKTKLPPSTFIVGLWNCLIILYENVCQNPELFHTQVSLSPEQSTLAPASEVSGGHTIPF
jgi:hypothetical protein